MFLDPATARALGHTQVGPERAKGRKPAAVPMIGARVAGNGKLEAMSRTRQLPIVEVSLEPDPVIECYKRDVDRTLLRANLQRTPEERLQNLMALQRSAEALREAGRRARQQR